MLGHDGIAVVFHGYLSLNYLIKVFDLFLYGFVEVVESCRAAHLAKVNLNAWNKLRLLGLTQMTTTPEHVVVCLALWLILSWCAEKRGGLLWLGLSLSLSLLTCATKLVS